MAWDGRAMKGVLLIKISLFYEDGQVIRIMVPTVNDAESTAWKGARREVERRDECGKTLNDKYAKIRSRVLHI